MNIRLRLCRPHDSSLRRYFMQKSLIRGTVLALCVAGIPAFAAVYKEAGGRVVIEAEHFDARTTNTTDNHVWQIVPDENGNPNTPVDAGFASAGAATTGAAIRCTRKSSNSRRPRALARTGIAMWGKHWSQPYRILTLVGMASLRHRPTLRTESVAVVVKCRPYGGSARRESIRSDFLCARTAAPWTH